MESNGTSMLGREMRALFVIQLSRIAPWVYRLLAVAFMALLFHLSSQPNLVLPIGFSWEDKLAHAGAYGLLAVLLAFGFCAPRSGMSRRQQVAVVLVVAAYGLSDEFHQSLVPGRDVSALDWLADVAGGVAAVSLLRGNGSIGLETRT